MNIISLVLDLIIIAVVAYCAWRGYKGGMIVNICGVVAIIIALCVGNIVAKVYSNEVSSMLETFGTGIVDTAAAESIAYDGTDENGEVSDYYVVLTEEEKEDTYAVGYATLQRVGLSTGLSEKIAAETSKDVVGVNQDMRSMLTEKMCAQIAFFIVFIVVFALVAIIFAAIGNIVNLSFEIPGLEKVNKYIGLAIGIFKGIVVAMIIASALRYFGVILGPEKISNTWIAGWLANSNAIANIFGL